MQNIDHCTVRDFNIRRNNGQEIRRKTPKSDVRISTEIWQLMRDLESTKISVKEFLFLSASKYEPLQLISREEDEDESPEVIEF